MGVKRQYQLAKDMLKLGRIETFEQLVSFLPYTTLAKDSNIPLKRMEKLKKNIDELKLGELIKISDVLEINLNLLGELAFNQLEEKLRENKG
jgi:hypothetical protein